MARLLDRYDAMQGRSLGGNTALNDGNQAGVGGVAGSQYRRMTEAYNRALRGLRKAFRDGDVRAGMQEIAVRQDAMDKGYTPGGVRKKDEFDSRIMSRVSAMGQAADDREMGRDFARRRMRLALGEMDDGQETDAAGVGPNDQTDPAYQSPVGTAGVGPNDQTDPAYQSPAVTEFDDETVPGIRRRRGGRLAQVSDRTPWWSRIE